MDIEKSRSFFIVVAFLCAVPLLFAGRRERETSRYQELLRNPRIAPELLRGVVLQQELLRTAWQALFLYGLTLLGLMVALYLQPHAVWSPYGVLVAAVVWFASVVGARYTTFAKVPHLQGADLRDKLIKVMKSSPHDRLWGLKLHQGVLLALCIVAMVGTALVLNVRGDWHSPKGARNWGPHGPVSVSQKSDGPAAGGQGGSAPSPAVIELDDGWQPDDVGEDGGEVESEALEGTTDSDPTGSEQGHRNVGSGKQRNRSGRTHGRPPRATVAREEMEKGVVPTRQPSNSSQQGRGYP